MSSLQRKLLRVALLALIALTAAFAFVQSSLSPEASSSESGAVGDVIGEIIPPETPVGGYVQTNIRKIAHFVEFALLGAEVAVYILVFTPWRERVILSYPFAVITAFLDESIQMFTDRGPAISDVWIDFSGFVCASLIVYAFFFAARFVLRAVRSKSCKG